MFRVPVSSASTRFVVPHASCLVDKSYAELP